MKGVGKVRGDMERESNAVKGSKGRIAQEIGEIEEISVL